MTKLEYILDKLEKHIPNYEMTNTVISNATIGWQINHSLIVINAVMEQLIKSNPENYKWKFNKNRLLIQFTNKIPRGKAKVPKSVNPPDATTENELKYKFELTRKNIAYLEKLPHNSHLNHPVFGNLNLKSAIWFMKLHTNHHLKIIEDIAKK